MAAVVLCAKRFVPWSQRLRRPRFRPLPELADVVEQGGQGPGIFTLGPLCLLFRFRVNGPRPVGLWNVVGEQARNSLP